LNVVGISEIEESEGLLFGDGALALTLPEELQGSITLTKEQANYRSIPFLPRWSAA